MDRAVILLEETKHTVEGEEELLIVMLSIAMMVVVTPTSCRQAEGNNVLRSPWKVEPTVQLHEKKDDDTVVYAACKRMDAEKVECDDGEADLEDLFDKREPDDVSSSCLLHRVVLGVYRPVYEWNFVHNKVATKEKEIVHHQTASYSSHDSQSCRRTKRSEATVSTRGENIPSEKRKDIHQKLKEMTLFVRLGIVKLDIPVI